MARFDTPTADRYAAAPASRWRGGVAALLVEAVIGLALIRGLVVAMPSPPAAIPALLGFETLPPPPPERTRPHPKHSQRREGAASPPNLRAKASEVVAPPPIIPVPLPPVMVAAPVAGPGLADHSGAADIVGPGSGSGGIGNGTGSGGAGDGDGDGGDELPPRHVRGRLKDSDYPAALSEAGIGGTVDVRYSVEVDGHVGRCEVTRSSGSALLDATTCRLIVERFRFKPARDGRGRPVPSTIVESHSWLMQRLPPED